MLKIFTSFLFIFQTACLFGINPNQTPDITPILPPGDLPFEIEIEQMHFSLPNGWHSGALGIHKDKVLLIAGRTNGMHGFDNNPNVNNFPPRAQNTIVYVIDFDSHKVWSRNLAHHSSGLTQDQIDFLSVTSPQSYQREDTLYITGGYGIDTATGTMGTKAVLTAVDIEDMIDWTMHKGHKTAAQCIRQTSNLLVQVTGGYMNQIPGFPTLLIFGQNFTGLYTGSSNGDYTNQVRTFHILDDGCNLAIVPSDNQHGENPDYRRRDLNVVPVILPASDEEKGYIALSGVFTEQTGIWTVPVFIYPNGDSSEPDPSNPLTFKQGMNNYASPVAGLFSKKTQDMYMIVFGGITFGYFENGIFKTDFEFPFTNEVTTIKLDKHGTFTQYIMENQFPTIISTYSNPGNTLLFGAGGDFIPNSHLKLYRNDVIDLDHFPKKHSTVLGYIVGGIQSTLPNTNTITDSAASPYIFQVKLKPRCH